ncbi:hypothetical protein ACQCVH_17910 [Bacillus infantis]|uniref:hypothetical protein n=1 Tax=Bacillus infantis TaxID=324767 RepID=UPI003CF84184
MNLDQRIAEAKQKEQQYEKYTKRLEALKAERDQEKASSAWLKTTWEKELNEADKLEGPSLSGFFLMISGKKEERLQKEKEEAYKARLLYDESLKKIKDYEADISMLGEKAAGLETAGAEYKELLLEKERLVLQEGGAVSDMLFHLSDRLEERKAMLQEIREAESALVEAREALRKADGELSSAKNWGFLDLAGGDFLSTMAKRSHMDKAKESLHDAQYNLKKLQKELDDLGRSISAELEVGSFLGIADLFFDNIFSDWMVQEKINASAEKVKECLNVLEDLETELRTEKDAAEQEIETLKKKRVEYLA